MTTDILRKAFSLTGALFPLIASLQAQERPTEPYVEQGVCPFECCTYRGWTATDSIIVYRVEGSTDTSFLLLPADSFTAVTGNVHLIHVGVVLIRQAMETEAEDSFPQAHLSVGDSAFVLSYRGEGWYDVWIAGKVRHLPAFWDDRREDPRPTDRPGRLIREPEDIWWVQIRAPDGRTGWIRMDHAEVSGSDACG
jgi:hypothetical protein